MSDCKPDIKERQIHTMMAQGFTRKESIKMIESTERKLNRMFDNPVNPPKWK